MLDPYFRPRGDGPALLALGCMNFGKRTAADQALAIIDRALGEGIGLLDTANVYNQGESERIVGRALRGRRDRVLVASKVGLDRVGRKSEGLAGPAVRAACEASLKRLGTDRLDLYYLHAPDPETPIEQTLDAVGTLLAQGRIRHWGVSNFASWQVLELMHLAEQRGLPGPVVAQQLYNPLVRQLDIEYFAFARRYGIHTTIYNPLAGGLLAGKHHPDEPPAVGSRFDDNRMYQRRYWSQTLFDAVEALRAIARTEGMDLVTLSYAFCLGHEGVDSMLIGPGSLPHLDAALAARDVRIPAAVRDQVLAVGGNLAGTDVRYAR